MQEPSFEENTTPLSKTVTMSGIFIPRTPLSNYPIYIIQSTSNVV